MADITIHMRDYSGRSTRDKFGLDRISPISTPGHDDQALLVGAGRIYLLIPLLLLALDFEGKNWVSAGSSQVVIFTERCHFTSASSQC